MTEPKETVKTKIWQEIPEEDNPYAARVCHCAGYDVYGELVGRTSWTAYLYLMLKLELPTRAEESFLEAIAVAVAHPGPRDHSVRAAMNAGVGGSTRASALMAALAVGAGNLGGAREIVEVIRIWNLPGSINEKWRAALNTNSASREPDGWHNFEHLPGFDPNGVSCTQPVIQTLNILEELSPGPRLGWLRQHRSELENTTGCPIAMSCVIATAFADLSLSEGQAEMLYLMLRLPGAAAQALEQEDIGWSRYPFFTSKLMPMEKDEYQDVMTNFGERT